MTPDLIHHIGDGADETTERPADTRKNKASIEDPWFDQEPPVEIQSRGVIGPAIGYATLFVVGLIVWSAVFEPDYTPIDLEAMAGHGTGYASDPFIDGYAAGPEGWAASISEEANFSGDAEVLPAPRAGDWHYHFPEQGQTFKQFALQSRNHRTDVKSKLYVVQLGHLRREMQPVLAVTAEYLDAYYDTPVQILKPQDLPLGTFNARRRQYDAREVLDHLAEALPDDALGLVAVMDRDLYIPSVKYVFGLGSKRQRVSVFSVHRYGQDFRLTGEVGTVLRRSMTVAVHEFGHVLSMRHCTAFRCIMNGTHSLKEADRHPLHLCPVCRRKAEYAIGYHRSDRYARLLEFYDKYGFDNEAEFVRRRLDPPTVEFITDATER